LLQVSSTDICRHPNDVIQSDSKNLINFILGEQS
jgi:hypothetical protein